MCQKTIQDWYVLAEQELRDFTVENLSYLTPEGIEIKPVYTAEDVSSANLGALPGFAPFTRGVRATMYVNRPWTIRQYAGFSTAEDSNAFYRKNLQSGQKGLSVAFDLATHRGYDSDHPRVAGDVGKAGVAIDSVEDMKILFEGIPLDQMSVSMTMNGAVIPVLAMFIVAGQEQGVALGDLSGTIQNDILKEFMVRNTYIYPPDPSMRIMSDIIEYTASDMPKFNSISISGYHMQEAGATLAQELAFTLADGMEYVRAALKKGLDVDVFAPRLSFFFCIGMDIFMEAAKLRAARQLWARIMTDFGAKSDRSKMLRTHCQTSGVSLTEQDPHNNIIRTAYEALAAVLGGTQSLHTNSFDEAIALPSEFSARIARNTQLILQHETRVKDVVDPLGGSYYVEALTEQLVQTAWAMIERIEAEGGMAQAIAAGWPKMEIEQAAARRQIRIDKAEDVIVGVNQFRLEENAQIDILQVDNAKVRDGQIRRLARLRETRDEAACQTALRVLTDIARNGSGNLLCAAVEAARARASCGEITAAMELVFGRYRPVNRVIKGVYAQAYQEDPAYQNIQAKLRDYTSVHQSCPHVLIAKMGQDGHDRGAKIIATAFSDLGFKVDITDLFSTPQETAERAIELNVDAIGVSSLAAGHKTLVPTLIETLKACGREDIKVFVGGVVPEQDYDFLRAVGVLEIFGPGSDVIACAYAVLTHLTGVKRNR